MYLGSIDVEEKPDANAPIQLEADLRGCAPVEVRMQWKPVVPSPSFPSGSVVYSPRALLLLFLCLATLGACAPSNFGQTMQWHERARLDLARSGYMAGVINGKYVIVGGSHWVNKKKVWTDEVDIFNPATDTWSKGTPLPAPRSDAANVALGNALYMFGGGANEKIWRDALVYRNGKWHPLPSAELPVPLLYSIAVADHGLIYVMGGLSKYEDYSHLSSQMWVWNPKEPKAGWIKLQPFPGPGLITQAVAELNGKIYVLGGAKTGGKDVVNVDTAFEYDPATNKWTTLPNLPVKRRCWWGLPLHQEILLFGGYTTKDESEVFAYSPATSTLKQISDMPHGLCDAKFFRIGNSIYGVGGETAPLIRGKWTLEAVLPGTKGVARKKK